MLIIKRMLIMMLIIQLKLIIKMRVTVILIIKNMAIHRTIFLKNFCARFNIILLLPKKMVICNNEMFV